MNQADQNLAHALKLKFGTAPDQPNESQLTAIKLEILLITTTGRRPTDEEWRNIVSKYCPKTGFYKYAGLDNSDLNTLLAMATNTNTK